MLRGEKRAPPIDGGGGPCGALEGAPLEKKPREKMRDFDWSADNYALTWRLVDELRKPENKNVLFPDKNQVVKTGDTKEDVYRRIAKVIHPEAYTTDPHVAGSRMKNKNVSMWKEYSGYCRRLQELCETHQASIPAAGPDESCPSDIHAEWRKIVLSMPVFQVLRTFMPIRSEEKAKAPTARSAPRVSTNGTYTHSPQSSLKDEQVVDHSRESRPPLSYSGPAPSPSVHQANGFHDTIVGAVEGQSHANGVDSPTINHTKHKATSSLQEYLDLRRSFQEDVRLGIFTPVEAKLHIEALDKQRAQLESARSNHVTSVTPSPVSSASNYGHPAVAPAPAASIVAPDPMIEHVYEEKALQLGFRKPVSPLSPLSRLSFKDLFKAILDHAAECELQECRLDNRRKIARLGFTAPAHPPDYGNSPVEIGIATRSGFVPLSQHAPAACARFDSRHAVPMLDIPLAIHSSSSWETTIWDHVYAVVVASFRNGLTIEDIKTAQTSAHAMIADPNFRHQLQLLNENSTFFDLLRLGLLSGNTWSPGNATMTSHDVMEQVQHH